MRLEPRHERGFVNGQRLVAVKMAAGRLRRGAAGVKDVRPLFRRQAGEFEFLEADGGHGRDVAPVGDGFRRGLARLAKAVVGAVVGELEAEEGNS